MDTKKIKEGISVKELESFAKKHRFVLFFSFSLLLSSLFSFVFFAGWSAIFAATGGILGVIFPHKFSGFFQKAAVFFRKQEELTKLILMIAGLGFAIFLPIVTFFALGASGGKYLHGLSIEENGEIIDIPSEEDKS